MRIGINIPNSLFKRMEPLKQMINVSQVCRDAIQDWVDTYEHAMEKARQNGMEEVAAVLTHKWESYEVDWQAIGHEDAHIWAQKATPDNFEHFAHNLKIGRSKGRTPGIWMAPHLPGTKVFGERQAEHEEWFAQQCELDWDSNPYLRAQEEYERGWTSYIITILDMAKRRTGSEEVKQSADNKQG